jgi:acyl carrier protein
MKQTPSEQEIQAWLIANVAAVVEMEPRLIKVDEQLENYGMDSLQATHLSNDLQGWLGRQLSPTIVWDYPTIESLAHYLANNGQ